VAWTQQQSAALSAIGAWARQRGGQQVMKMFGFAGTGKTTLADSVSKDIDGTIFCAPTGKASLVLRKKGCTGAQTIHSTIYKALEDDVTGEVSFKLNPDSPAAGARLIVVDEASMVDEEIGRDLMSFGTKILVLGDPAQLPPVRGEGFFTAGQPDIMLTEIHRQAADNPIIRMSMEVREGRGLKPGNYGTSRVISRADVSRDEMRSLVMDADQLLVGMNKTRTTFNTRIRSLRGISDPLPVVGDKLICLKNNRTKGLLNGGIWTAEGVRVNGKMVSMRVTTTDDPDILTPLDVETPVQFFLDREKELDWKARKRIDEFNYGYAITVHKSQGSAWDDVVVFDESRVFREDADKHLYTAVTRAAERVVVVLD